MRRSMWKALALCALAVGVALMGLPAQAQNSSALVGGYSVMRPDAETFHQWVASYKNAPKAPLIHNLRSAAARGATEFDLLSHIQYTPAERNQQQCGDCWVWAGTGCLEVALDVQKSIKERLSIQWFHANYYATTGKYACGGGWLEGFSTEYAQVGTCIPWSNTNAQFQDGDGNCHTTNPNQITSNPNYAITSITTETIPTFGVGQATAISNVKNVLNQNKAVWFGFFAPTGKDGDEFMNFWSNKTETDVFSYDAWSGHTADSKGWGHAVLIVGYDETDAANPCWIVLNSWGYSTNRPHTLYRFKMKSNYDAYQVSGGAREQIMYFQTLDVAFGGGGTTYSISGTVGGSVSGGAALTLSGGTSKTATSGADGSYTFSGLSNGSYTVTPSYNGATFTPASQSVTINGASQTGVNFTATGGTAAISMTNPVGGEKWDSGGTYSIAWLASGVVGNVVISALKGGAAIEDLGTVDCAAGTFNWTIPSGYESGSDYQIKVASQANPALVGTSGEFSITTTRYYATIGSAYELSGVTFSSKPKVYIENGGKQVAAKIFGWDSKDPTFVDFIWTGKASEGSYTLLSACKKEEPVLWTDNFYITPPLLSSYAMYTPDPPDVKNYYMVLYGVTGSAMSSKPKVWWDCSTGSCTGSGKVSCTVCGCGYDGDVGAEYVIIKYSCKSFDKINPDRITIKNALGQNSYLLGGSGAPSFMAMKKIQKPLGVRKASSPYRKIVK